MAEFPARIHVLLAGHAPLGLVIRRGPSKHVATLLWDRRTDEFQLGQWMKGRIYERRCDLSPDGKHFLYFAMNGKWQSESQGSWTAISRAPYLRALAFFPKGDCWHGGGLWTSNAQYWLNDGGHSVLRDSKEFRRDMLYQPTEDGGGECLGVYYERLVRDGWRRVESTKVSRWRHRDLLEKDCPLGWVLQKIAHAEIDSPDGKGCYWDEHRLIHPASGAEIAGQDWEWAEVDRERIVWASAGKLFSATFTKDGLIDQALLFDFNPMKFKAIEAPYS